MENNFVPYLESKMLAELGFNDRCIAFYQNSVLEFRLSFPINHIYQAEIEHGKTPVGIKQKDVYSSATLAPTWQQAEEWLWDAHGLMVVVKMEKEHLSLRVWRESTRDEAIIFGNAYHHPIIARREGIKRAIQFLHKEKHHVPRS